MSRAPWFLPQHCSHARIAAAQQATVYCGHPELLYAVVERLRLAGEQVRPLCVLAWATLTPPAAAVALP